MLNTVPILIESIKTEDSEHFLQKILHPQQVIPSKSCFCLNMKLGYSLRAVLFALYYSNLLIYCHLIFLILTNLREIV